MRLIDINPHIRMDDLLPVVKEAIPGRKKVKSLDNLNSGIIDEAVASVKEVYQQYLNNDSCSTQLFAMLEKTWQNR